jgi:cell division protein FtsW (lipid II flippase)
VVLIAAIGWFLCFLVTLESLTGLLILVLTSVLIIVYLAYRKTGVIWGSLVLLLMVFASSTLAKLVLKKYESNFHVSESEYAAVADTTQYGQPYTHDFSRRDVENGHLVFININWDEMSKAWQERSRMPFDGKDLRDQELRYTLLRFLAFKGWHKDYDAVMHLSADEVKMVERGHTKPGQSGVSNLQSRIEEVMWEVHNYRLYGTHGGHSVMQRWVFWKTSLAIIRAHPAFGVGTGDVMQAFEQQYSTWPTTLEKKWQLRAHNQYLAMAVAFGIPGMLFFLATLIAPMFLLKKQHSFLYVTFLITALLSMVAEDTLETQAGVTFYAFFNAFFLFVFRNGDAADSL